MLSMRRILGLSLLLWISGQSALASDGHYLELEDGEKLYYQRWGEGPTTVIVSSLTYTEPLAQALASPEYTVIAYDPRGRGRSSYVEDGSSLNIQQDVLDLEALRLEVNSDKVNLVGFSFAGRIVLAYASKYPEKVGRISLLAPAPRSFADDYDLAADKRVPMPASFLDRLSEINSLRSSDAHVRQPQAYCYEERSLFPLAWASIAANQHLLVPFAHKLCQLEYFNEWPVYFDRYREFSRASRANLFTDEFLDRITSPTLLVHGSGDRNSPLGGSRFWAWRLATAKLIIEPKQAHGLLIEKPEVVSGYLKMFFNGRWPEQAISQTHSPLK